MPSSSAQSAAPGARYPLPREPRPVRERHRLHPPLQLPRSHPDRYPWRRSAAPRQAATSALRSWQAARFREGARREAPAPSAPISERAFASVPPASDRSPSQARTASRFWPSRGRTLSAWGAPAAGRLPVRFRRRPGCRCRSPVELQERSSPTRESSRALGLPAPVPRAARSPVRHQIAIPNRSSVYRRATELYPRFRIRLVRPARGSESCAPRAPGGEYVVQGVLGDRIGLLLRPVRSVRGLPVALFLGPRRLSGGDPATLEEQRHETGDRVVL